MAHTVFRHCCGSNTTAGLIFEYCHMCTMWINTSSVNCLKSWYSWSHYIKREEFFLLRKWWKKLMSRKLSWELWGNHCIHEESGAESSSVKITCFCENHSFQIFLTYVAQHGNTDSCLELLQQSQETWSSSIKPRSDSLQTLPGFHQGLWDTRYDSGLDCSWIFRRLCVAGRAPVLFSI